MWLKQTEFFFFKVIGVSAEKPWIATIINTAENRKETFKAKVVDCIGVKNHLGNIPFNGVQSWRAIYFPSVIPLHVNILSQPSKTEAKTAGALLNTKMVWMKSSHIYTPATFISS